MVCKVNRKILISVTNRTPISPPPSECTAISFVSKSTRKFFWNTVTCHLGIPSSYNNNQIPYHLWKNNLDTTEILPTCIQGEDLKFCKLSSDILLHLFSKSCNFSDTTFTRHSHLQFSHDSNCWLPWSGNSGRNTARTLTCQSEARISEKWMQTTQDSTKDNRMEILPEEAVSISEPLKKWISKI